MFAQKKLENLGIEVIDRIEDEKVIKIVDEVSTKIKNTFSNANINYLEIYKTLLDTPMYYAKIPDGLSEVNYLYKTSTIYFSDKMNWENIGEYVYHEFIHRLQERKDKKGNLTRMGICEVNEISVKGTALNEGAIQYLVSKILEYLPHIAVIYDIFLPIKTEYYPLLTNLVSQLAFLLDENILIDSTINGNENFKIEIMENIGENEYCIIEKNMNTILKTKDCMAEYQKNEEKIDKSIKYIRSLFYETQTAIYKGYFDKILKRVENDFEVEMIKKKIYEYKSMIGYDKENNDFENYYEEFLSKADAKIEDFRNKKALMVIKDNFIFKIFRKIKGLFKNSKSENYK